MNPFYPTHLWNCFSLKPVFFGLAVLHKHKVWTSGRWDFCAHSQTCMSEMIILWIFTLFEIQK